MPKKDNDDNDDGEDYDNNDDDYGDNDYDVFSSIQRISNTIGKENWIPPLFFFYSWQW